MSDFESLGFSALLSYQTKIGVAEGVLLGAGAALSLGLGYLGSRRSGARAELTQEEIEAPFKKVVYGKDVNKWEDDLLAYNLQLPAGKKPAVVPPKSVIETIVRFGFTPAEYAKIGRALPFNGLKNLYMDALGHSLQNKSDLASQYRKAAAQYAKSLKDSIDRFSEKTLLILSAPGPGGSSLTTKADAFQKYLDLGASDEEVRGILSNVTSSGENLYDLTRSQQDLTERLKRYRALPQDVFMDFRIPPEIRLWIAPEQLREIVNVHDNLEKSGATEEETTAVRLWDEEKDPQTGVRKIDTWKNIEGRLRRVRDVPQRTLRALNIQPDRWLFWELLSDDEKSDAFTLEAALNVCSSAASKDLIADLAQRRVDLEKAALGKPMPLGGAERVKQIGKLAKSGKLAKIDKLFKAAETEKPKTFGDLLKAKDQTVKFDLAVHAIANSNAAVPDTLGQLLEFSDLYFASVGSATPLSPKDPFKGVKRFYDRLAQEDQDWAITEFPSEYERGKRIAPIIKDAIDYITSIVKKGDNVFIHGRDGELIYEILKKQKGLDLSKIRYAITSRPLTTEAKTVDSKYMDYLRRMIPPNAVHIDTGFEGSIPKWLMRQGFPIRGIKMVSATRIDEEIPSTAGLTPLQLRNIVLSDLEHSSQRLENPKNLTVEQEGKALGGFHFLTYSDAAPGFWARVYGVEDALGIPRLRVQPATSYEKRFRVATTPEADEAEEQALTALSKKKV